MGVKYYEFLAERIHPAEFVEIIKRLVGIKRRHISMENLSLYIDPVSHFGLRIIRDHSYEPELKQVLKNLLAAGDNFIDLGGNEGFFSLVAAKQVGRNGRVFCIEPQERLWPVILTNIATNECFNIQLLPFAIDMHKGELEMTLTPSVNTGSSQLSKNIRTYFWTKQKVRTFPLDQVIEDYRIDKVKLIKIDIEGYELNALRSARESLKKGVIENLVIEVHPKQLSWLNQSVDELIEFLQSVGYEVSEHFKNLNLFVFSRKRQ